jgi:hypothetical protein
MAVHVRRLSAAVSEMSRHDGNEYKRVPLSDVASFNEEDGIDRAMDAESSSFDGPRAPEHSLERSGGSQTPFSLALVSLLYGDPYVFGVYMI